MLSNPLYTPIPQRQWLRAANRNLSRVQAEEKIMREDVQALPPIESEKLEIVSLKSGRRYDRGRQVFQHWRAEAGLSRTLRVMRTVNRFDGYDCLAVLTRPRRPSFGP